MRWTVRPGDGPTVRDVLARAGADADAVRDGRVFLGRTRVRSDEERVQVGDEIDVAPPQQPAGEGVTVLAQEGDLIAVAKPAGIPTIPDHGGASHSLVARVAKTLGLEAVRVHPTSRLDSDVSGVVVFALSREAGERLMQARAQGRYERRYLALAKHAPAPPRGTWDAPIGRGRDPKLRAVNGRDAVPATTRYAVTAIAAAGGRRHARRFARDRPHAPDPRSCRARRRSAARRPSLRGSDAPDPSDRARDRARAHRAARRARRGAQARGEPLVLLAPLPPELASLWSALGGEPAAWEVSLACDLSAFS